MTDFDFNTTIPPVSPGVDNGSVLQDAGSSPRTPARMSQSGVTRFLLLTAGLEEPEVDYVLAHGFCSPARILHAHSTGNSMYVTKHCGVYCWISLRT